VVANAGIYPQKTIEEMSESEWDQVMNVNVKGTFLIVKSALSHLKSSRHGRVVVISSITGPLTGLY
jgi:3-oxoacyl-[acyl-carrier protein] reductase